MEWDFFLCVENLMKIQNNKQKSSLKFHEYTKFQFRYKCFTNIKIIFDWVPFNQKSIFILVLFLALKFRTEIGDLLLLFSSYRFFWLGMVSFSRLCSFLHNHKMGKCILKFLWFFNPVLDGKYWFVFWSLVGGFCDFFVTFRWGFFILFWFKILGTCAYLD